MSDPFNGTAQNRCPSWLSVTHRCEQMIGHDGEHTYTSRWANYEPARQEPTTTHDARCARQYQNRLNGDHCDCGTRRQEPTT